MTLLFSLTHKSKFPFDQLFTVVHLNCFETTFLTILHVYSAQSDVHQMIKSNDILCNSPQSLDECKKILDICFA